MKVWPLITSMFSSILKGNFFPLCKRKREASCELSRTHEIERERFYFFFDHFQIHFSMILTKINSKKSIKYYYFPKIILIILNCINDDFTNIFGQINVLKL